MASRGTAGSTVQQIFHALTKTNTGPAKQSVPLRVPETGTAADWRGPTGTVLVIVHKRDNPALVPVLWWTWH